MAFISGIQIIHAPSSALNNAGNDPSASTQNAVAVKSLRAGRKAYPYVSAQAYRFWLRNQLESLNSWESAPIFREKKVAYTDANPILYCDDDIFGYMRAPGKKTEAADSRAEMTGATETKETVTRVSPFRASTLVALSDGITRDFGTMSRHEGDPVPYEHQLYRTSLKGMLSLDLSSMGVFSYENRTGFLNLDDKRIKLAQEKKLIHDESKKTYRLADTERIKRINSLLAAIPVVQGGAKLGLHYTDVSPAVVVMAVTKGGNNPLQYLIDGDEEGNARPVLDAFEEVGNVWGDTLLSPLYVGWVQGYAQNHRTLLTGKLEELSAKYPQGIVLDHPRKIFEQLASSLSEHTEWLS